MDGSRRVYAVPQPHQQMNHTTDTPRTDAWECFSDPSYYDMARLRRTDGPKDFNTGYHLNNLREAIEVRDTLNELERRADKAEAEVERLKKQRDKAIKIAMKALRPELLLDGSLESKVDLLVKIAKLQSEIK